MSEKIVAALAAFIIAVISASGYAGVLLLMALESACIPLPSEVIMPFAGYLVHTGRLSLIGVATAGALGCNLGSLVAWYIGAFGGRPFIARYGRFVLLNHHDLERANYFFHRFGGITVFLGRLLPIVGNHDILSLRFTESCLPCIIIVHFFETFRLLNEDR